MRLDRFPCSSCDQSSLLRIFSNLNPRPRAAREVKYLQKFKVDNKDDPTPGGGGKLQRTHTTSGAVRRPSWLQNKISKRCLEKDLKSWTSFIDPINYAYRGPELNEGWPGCPADASPMRRCLRASSTLRITPIQRSASLCSFSRMPSFLSSFFTISWSDHQKGDPFQLWHKKWYSITSTSN